ncbi:hypothetical protein COOONC_00704 [Cooperia oncophora]
MNELFNIISRQSQYIKFTKVVPRDDALTFVDAHVGISAPKASFSAQSLHIPGLCRKLVFVAYIEPLLGVVQVVRRRGIAETGTQARNDERLDRHHVRSSTHGHLDGSRVNEAHLYVSASYEQPYSMPSS